MMRKRLIFVEPQNVEWNIKIKFAKGYWQSHKSEL